MAPDWSVGGERFHFLQGVGYWEFDLAPVSIKATQLDSCGFCFCFSSPSPRKSSKACIGKGEGLRIWENWELSVIMLCYVKIPNYSSKYC